MDKKKTVAIVTVCIIVILAIILFLLLNRKYTVTFDSNGGTVVKSQTVQRNHTAVEPKDPTRKGYIFLGWYINEKDKFNFNTKIDKDIKLTAKWATEGASKVSIKASKKIMNVNEELALSLELEPKDLNKDDLKIVWSSSDESIATVDKNGKVTAHKAGKVIITVDVNGKTATFEINVVEKNKTEETNKNKSTSSSNNSSSNNSSSNNSSSNTNTQPEITYTYKWESIGTSVIGQEYLYIVSSEGKKVAGTATITTKSGKSETVSIPASGVMYIRDTIASVSNVKAN